MEWELLSVFLYWLLLAASGAAGALLLDKKFEEILPFAMMGQVMIVFLTGICGQLRLGFWLVCLISAVGFLFGLYRACFQKTSCCAVIRVRDAGKNIVTVGFAVFSILYLIHAASVFRMMPHGWDEFSFWAVSVKKMWFLDKFYCHPDAGSGGFYEYPPGMQILEYIAQGTAGRFADWKIYSAYGTYIIALLVFFLRKLVWNKRDMLMAVTASAALVMSGCFFYNYYSTVTVDFALGITFAFGTAFCLLSACEKGVSIESFLYAALVSCMLVLIKSAGKLFACLLILMWILQAVRKGGGKKQAAKLPLLAAPFVVSILWEWRYKSYGKAASFDAEKYNIAEFLRILTGSEDYGYRTGIKNKFISFFWNEKAVFGRFSVTNIVFVITSAFLLALIFIWLSRKGIQLEKCVLLVFFAGAAVYWIGLMMSYMYTFSEQEGTALASMQRYLNIYHCAAGMLAVFLLVSCCKAAETNRAGLYIALLACAVCSGADVKGLVSRSYAHASQRSTQQMRELSQMFDLTGSFAAVGEKGTIVLVHQEGYPHMPVNGFAYFVYPYYYVPWECKYGSMPTFDGDNYTKILTASEFALHIEELGADYIAISDLNQDFINQYSGLFQHSLENGQVYRVAGHGHYELVE